MNITRNFREAVQERTENDENFAAALLDEVIQLFLDNEPDIARLVLRNLSE